MAFIESDYVTPPELAKMLGVHESTIKRWVNKGFLEADVTDGGHRRISQKQLQEFIDGYPQYVKRSYILSRLFKDYSGADAKALLDEYYDYLLQEKVEESLQYVQRLYSAQVQPVEVANILLHAIFKIEDDLQSKAISLYQQKRMLAIIREDGKAVLSLIPNPDEDCSRIAMIAGVQGETDDVLLIIIELVLRSRGWCVKNIGINIGNTELREQAAEINPDIICMSKEGAVPVGIGCFYQLAYFMRKKDKPICTIGRGWPGFIKNKSKKADAEILHVEDIILLDRFLKRHER